jgi:hypothetical protein
VFAIFPEPKGATEKKYFTVSFSIYNNLISHLPYKGNTHLSVFSKREQLLRSMPSYICCLNIILSSSPTKFHFSLFIPSITLYVLYFNSKSLHDIYVFHNLDPHGNVDRLSITENSRDN